MTTLTTELTKSESLQYLQDGPEGDADPHRACRETPLPVASRQRTGFWSYVLKTDCCWLWIRSRIGTLGYGCAWHGGRNIPAHKAAYLTEVGPVPVGHEVMHTCDVPHCVRPDHLRVGTHAENQQDMARKGRHGGDGRRHLTDPQVYAMRRLRLDGWTLQELADHFRIKVPTVSNIVNRKTWRHLPDEAVEAAA